MKQHAEMVIAAAARRPKAIICQKPMAVSLGEAEAMMTACERNGVKLAIINREPTDFDDIADLVVRQDIGTVLEPFIAT